MEMGSFLEYIGDCDAGMRLSYNPAHAKSTASARQFVMASAVRKAKTSVADLS